MKLRSIASTIKRAITTFPALVVTGPRQSGKTTLLKYLFSKTHLYASLEDPDVRLRARGDPIEFLENYQKPVILDEIQYVPELLPFIKSAIDINRYAGRFILTGSQSFNLMKGVSESLAGRAAILTLLPFTIAERFDLGAKTKLVETIVRPHLVGYGKKISTYPLGELIFRGSYPEIASNPSVDRGLWCGSYITTYLERDIRSLTQVGDLGQFELFLRACAVRTGQILDLAGISRELGISLTTAKRWLSLLETGNQVYLLYPYYKNIGKRLIKRPKLYFTDTGLASYLLGFSDSNTLSKSSSFAALFETMVVIDILKRFYNAGELPSLYYLRTRDGLEVDLVIERSGKLTLIEIKSSSTITVNHAASLVRAVKDLTKLVAAAYIISGTADNFSLGKGIFNFSWRQILLK